MLLESHLNKDTILYIDVEPMQGFAKDEGTHDFHPDQVLENVVKVSTLVAQQLAETAAAASEGAHQTPSRLTLEFGIKVDLNAVVSLAPKPGESHFKITAEWAPKS